MAYFPDLAPYAYANRSHPGVLHVGWLDAGEPYTRGKVDRRVFAKLKRLAQHPVERYRGYHHCPYCTRLTSLIYFTDQRKSNAEIRVTLEGVTYAAPTLIVHYIRAHRYRPPDVFLRAVEAAPEPF